MTEADKTEERRAVWRTGYDVRYGESNRQGQLKLRALADYFQEAAAHHAEHLGDGVTMLAEQHLLWVLSRMAVEVYRLPEAEEKLTLETWPRFLEQALFAMREFELRDAAGEVVVRATSAWLLIDAEKYRPRRLSKLPVPMPPNQDRPYLYEHLDELPDIEAPVMFIDQVRESMIDVNQHMNNAEYFSWLEDCEALAGVPLNAVQRIFINFIAEARYGDSVAVHAGYQVKEGVLSVYGVRVADGKTIFRARLMVDGAQIGRKKR